MSIWESLLSSGLGLGTTLAGAASGAGGEQLFNNMNSVDAQAAQAHRQAIADQQAANDQLATQGQNAINNSDFDTANSLSSALQEGRNKVNTLYNPDFKPQPIWKTAGGSENPGVFNPDNPQTQDKLGSVFGMPSQKSAQWTEQGADGSTRHMIQAVGPDGSLRGDPQVDHVDQSAYTQLDKDKMALSERESNLRQQGFSDARRQAQEYHQDVIDQRREAAGQRLEQNATAQFNAHHDRWTNAGNAIYKQLGTDYDKRRATDPTASLTPEAPGARQAFVDNGYIGWMKHNPEPTIQDIAHQYMSTFGKAGQPQTGQVQLNPTIAATAQALTQKGLGTVTSGVRTPEHDREVGGSGKGNHVDGNAVDFSPAPGVPLQAIANEVIKSGLRPIITDEGTPNAHVHFDTGINGNLSPLTETHRNGSPVFTPMGGNNVNSVLNSARKIKAGG